MCLLCGEEYRAVRAAHLRSKHGFEGDHPVREYEQRFGLRFATCRDTRRLQSRGLTEHWRRTGRHWSSAQMIAEIQGRVRVGKSVSLRALAGLPWGRQIWHRFGSWTKAMCAAGLDPEEHRATIRWTRARVIEAVRTLCRAGLLNGLQAQARDSRVYGAAKRQFGTWHAALRAGGLDPPRRPARKHWSVARARAWVRERRRRGRPITYSEAPASLVGHVRRHGWMNWGDFVESLGIRYPGTRPKRDWTDAAVLGSIRDLSRRGKSMNWAAAERLVPGVIHQATIRFGSWDVALRKAGFDPQHVRLRSPPWNRQRARAWVRTRLASGLPITSAHVPQGLKRWMSDRLGTTWTAFVESLGMTYPGRKTRSDWTNAKVLAEIRERHRRGLPLHTAVVGRSVGSLYAQARSRFGSWEGALSRAGLDPAGFRRTPVWSRESVLAALRERHARGLSMTCGDVRQDQGKLARAASRWVATSWKDVLRMAGIHPELGAPVRVGRGSGAGRKPTSRSHAGGTKRAQSPKT